MWPNQEFTTLLGKGVSFPCPVGFHYYYEPLSPVHFPFFHFLKKFYCRYPILLHYIFDVGMGGKRHLMEGTAAHHSEIWPLGWM